MRGSGERNLSERTKHEVGMRGSRARLQGAEDLAQQRKHHQAEEDGEERAVALLCGAALWGLNKGRYGTL